MHDVGEVFAESEDIDADLLLKRVLFYALRTTKATAGAIYLQDAGDDLLHAWALSGVFPPLVDAVDGRTEHQILHNMRQWGEGRTVIISAHRLSALTEASEILVLQHGHVAQRGRHEALAVQPGWYRDMYRYQQLEAALDEVPQEQEEALDA